MTIRRLCSDDAMVKAAVNRHRAPLNQDVNNQLKSRFINLFGAFPKMLSSYFMSEPREHAKKLDPLGIAFALTCKRAHAVWSEYLAQLGKGAPLHGDWGKRERETLFTNDLQTFLREDAKPSEIAAELLKQRPKASSWNLRGSDLTERAWKQLFESLQHCTQVTSLLLAHCSVRQENGQVVDLGLSSSLFADLGRCAHLEELDYAGELADDSLRYLTGCRELRTLKLQGLKGSSKEGLACLQQLPKLSKVIWEHNQLSLQEALPILGAIPTLTDLQLADALAVNGLDKGMPRFLELCQKRLTKLDLEVPPLGIRAALQGIGSCKKLTTVFLKEDAINADPLLALLQECSALEQVKLRGKVSAEAMQQFTPRVPNLRLLVLDNINQEIAAAIGSCTQLTDLTVCCTAGVTDNTMQSIAKCNNLASLTLKQCCPSDKGILLLRGLPLKYLEVTNSHFERDFQKGRIPALLLANRELTIHIDQEQRRYNRWTLFEFLRGQQQALVGAANNVRWDGGKYQEVSEERSLVRQIAPLYDRFIYEMDRFAQKMGLTHTVEFSQLWPLQKLIVLEENYTSFGRLLEQAEIGIDSTNSLHLPGIVFEDLFAARQQLGLHVGMGIMDTGKFVPRIEGLRHAQASIALKIMKLCLENGCETHFKEYCGRLCEIHPQMSAALEARLKPDMELVEQLKLLGSFAAEFAKQSQKPASSDRKDGT